MLPTVLLLGLAGRAASGFRVASILPLEAAVLATGGAVLLLAATGRRSPRHSADLWIGIVLLAAAVRAALWALGTPVAAANAAALATGLAMAFGFLAARRWQRARRTSRGPSPEQEA